MKIILSLMASMACITCIMGQVPHYVFQKKIALPGDGGYDYLYVDQPNHTLYVSHGTVVHAIDLATQTTVGEVKDLQGVHGIAVVNDIKQGFISDGRANSVHVFELQTFKPVADIPVSGKNPDAILYDPYSKKIFAFNHSSNNVSVIDPSLRREVALIELGGSPEFAVSDGKGKIFNNLEDKSQLIVIDSKTMKVENTYQLDPCGGPTGLALDLLHKRLFTVCRENKGMSVVNMDNGKVVTTVPIGAGVDAVAYDPINKLIYSSNGEGTVTIIQQESADTYRVAQTLSTQPRARTMTLDPVTHNIYLSVAESDPATRKIKPGTFCVLVYKMQ